MTSLNVSLIGILHLVVYDKEIKDDIKYLPYNPYLLASYPAQTAIPAITFSGLTLGSPRYLPTMFPPMENPTQASLVVGNLLTMSLIMAA